MRQDTQELSLEAQAKVPEFHIIAKQCAPMPDLHDVDVTVLGSGAAGHTIAYWHGLEQLWAEYFRRAGANLQRYSALRAMESTP